MKLGHNYFVYILECADKSYYTGITNDLERRIEEHKEGKNQKSYTYGRRPVVLKFYERFEDVVQAIQFEKQVKGWSRKKKQALLLNDWEEICGLAGKKE